MCIRDSLNTKRGTDGLVSPEDTVTYEKMEADVVALGKEIDRLEKQESLDRELSKPCLLYTSPSPRDRTRSRMPSSA